MSRTLERVIDEFQQREQRGISKYGTTVDRHDLEEWQWVKHAKEEAMDQVMYLQRLEDQLLNRGMMGKYTASVARSQETRSQYGAGGWRRQTLSTSDGSAWRRLLRRIVKPFGGTSAGSTVNEQERGGN